MKNKTKEDIKSGVLRGIFFLITVFTGGIIYAAIGSTWTAPSTLEVGAGSGLTATSWNKLLANFNNLDSRISASTTGKVTGGCAWGSAWGTATACGQSQGMACAAGNTAQIMTFHSAGGSAAWNSAGSYASGLCIAQ